MFTRLKKWLRRSRRRADERQEERKPSASGSTTKLQKKKQPQSTYTAISNEPRGQQEQQNQTSGIQEAADHTKQDFGASAPVPESQDSHSIPQLSTSNPHQDATQATSFAQAGPVNASSEHEPTPSAKQDGRSEVLLSSKEHYDYEIDHRAAVVHENIRPHVHTIYEPQITRDIHYHEHRTLIQPIIDPEPELLPEQHWLQDGDTGRMTKISSDVGEQLRNAPGIVSTQVNTLV